MAALIGDYPEFQPFETRDAHDVDSATGVRIVWGAMDKEFTEEWRTQSLLAWLDDMKTKAVTYFDMFEKAARSEEVGAESLPTVLSSFD
mmetsp:Transcript_32166/g.42624  ORF Transcript_32166/g.42624 Transcript_32166/m.42624 type:complete len:89 (+) Transcript_32166:540-806(+)|eukprot:CAMPEP_0185599710 /NCGR_PEP_ID=MMETSP0434-20130131/82887_1 /TAXON_ID=626734 ORGANISM="Favella taraikaensis, Strain Fe Narragansett Bay" /NCGR_SAMPLE_ID=MMETSP0434 /ASSEMBLY_ACC=CAM_ASM_000379 /LENGTH=88 /DNA_ID=CAMNT_0028229205 /DNA_START=916 /DNA_END=1185 /DNA_ORIENTATION=+